MKRKRKDKEELPPEFYNVLNACINTDLVCPHCHKIIKEPLLNTSFRSPTQKEIETLIP